MTKTARAIVPRPGVGELPVAGEPNPNCRNPLPESSHLCPTCGDSHLRELAAREGRIIATCGNGHRYRVPGTQEAT